MAHATIKLVNVDPKKKVVRFDYYDKDTDREDQEEQIITNIYVSKRLAKEKLGVKDLSKVKGVEVTIRVIK